MSKHGHKHDISHAQATERKQYQATTGQEMTPGRAPAEGPVTDIASPSHERIEQRTAERDTAEG